MQEQTKRRIIKWPQLKERNPESRTTVWRKMKAGIFPAAVTLGANSIGWYEDEIDAYLETRQRVEYAPTPHVNGKAVCRE